MVKMIDKNIPIEFISNISRKEANSRKPIYQIHKWFGRKTDAIFRSVLLGTQLDEKYIDNFKEIYYSDNHNILKNKIILDPFMGGGVTLVNTLRLGGKAIGIDVNPVAWFITKNELQVPEDDLTKVLKDEFYRLERTVGNEIKEAYTTKIFDNNENKIKIVDIMYVLWVKKAICPYCGKENKLFPKYIITKLNKKNYKNYNLCPKCGTIVRGNDEILVCHKCSYKFDKNIGVYKGRNFTCISCGKKSSLIKDIMKEREEPLSMDMYAIQYYDPQTCKKGFKVPDKEDIEKYEEAKNKVSNLKDELTKFIPQNKIPPGYNTKQVKNHNYNYWNQMFNHRQIYYLCRLLSEISSITNNLVKELFLCIFSNTINGNNMFCIYNAQCEKIEPLFGDHHMAPVMNPVENNLWGTKLGRGSFLKNFKSFIIGKKFNSSPYERCNINGKNNNIIVKDEKFQAEFTDNFEELVYGDKNTMIKCSTAENLSFLPCESIDAVVTDPPYYSAINYGEISEFFYVWDKTILKDVYKFFKPEHILYNNEVTVNEIKGMTKKIFIKKLCCCFKEVKRVLKKHAPLILTYNNSSPEGWQVLFESLIQSGFYVIKTYPIHTELRAGLIDNRRDKMNYDLIIVAKTINKHKKNQKIYINDFIDKVESEFKETYENLNDNNLALLDMLLIKVGKAFEIYCKYYPNIYIHNNKIGIEEILKLIYNKNFNCNK